MIFPYKRFIKPRLGARINRDHPLAKGLVGYWLMNEGGGNIVQDLSGNGSTGTITNGTWVAGPNGSVIDLSGTNSLIDFGVCPEPLKIYGPELTLSINFKLDVIGANNYLMGIDRQITGWALSVISGGAVVFYNGNASDTSTLTLATDIWYTLAVVAKGTDLKYYLNGFYRESDTIIASSYTAGRHFYMGVDPYDGADNNLNGKINYAFVCNRALSNSEIADSFANPFGMFKRDDIALWQSTGEAPTGNAGIMTLWGGYWGATY